jgi:heme exporter protein D
MEKNRANNIRAAALIVFLIAMVLLRIWAADREASCVGPAAVRTDENGRVYLVSANILYVHDRDGYLVGRIPLEKIGVDRFDGDFWIFRNGDLLVRRGVRQKQTFFRELQMFLRIGPGSRDLIEEDGGILQRCDLATFACREFGGGSGAFRKTTFKLAVDEEKGNVYISDTLEHRLLLYDIQGNLKRKSDVSFDFPNGILLAQDGLLYVADTNHHCVRGVSAEFESFGRIEKEFSIITKKAGYGRVWPTSILLAGNNQWWVINSGSDMQNGEVMVYDREGAFIKRIDLPGDADPVALAASGEHVLIADPTEMRIYRVSQDGKREDDFGSLLLNVELHELSRARSLYAFYKNASLVILVASLLLTVMLLLKTRQERERDVMRRKSRAASHDTSGKDI